jgi:hypothetical protein
MRALASAVDNWQQVDPNWLVQWITAHARDSANILKKPLMLEEVRHDSHCIACWPSNAEASVVEVFC